MFSIVSSTGVLRFKTAPNFEAPQDVGGGNNVYVVKSYVPLAAGWARVKTVDQTITVTVTDVDEPPGTPGCTDGVDAESVTSLMVRWSEPDELRSANQRLRLPVSDGLASREAGRR